MFVGGTDDPTWSPAVAREISPDVLELDGADDGLAAIEHVQQTVDSVTEFSARL